MEKVVSLLTVITAKQLRMYKIEWPKKLSLWFLKEVAYSESGVIRTTTTDLGNLYIISRFLKVVLYDARSMGTILRSLFQFFSYN